MPTPRSPLHPPRPRVNERLKCVSWWVLRFWDHDEARSARRRSAERFAHRVLGAQRSARAGACSLLGTAVFGTRTAWSRRTFVNGGESRLYRSPWVRLLSRRCCADGPSHRLPAWRLAVRWSPLLVTVARPLWRSRSIGSRARYLSRAAEAVWRRVRRSRYLRCRTRRAMKH